MAGKARNWFARRKVFLVALLAVLMVLCAQAFTTTANAAYKESPELTVLAFTSDAHNNSNNASANRLSTWIDEINEEYGQLDIMGFCGDMGPQSGSSSDFWNRVEQVMNVAESKVKHVVYTTGNHEYSPGSFSSTTNELKNKYKINEIGYASENVVVYCLGSEASSDKYSQTQIDTLTAFLNAEDGSRPIIIISHFPLHHYSSRTTTNADLVIDALNAAGDAGKKVVFLWGHNHTMSDPHYDQIYAPTDSIEYASGKTKEINFYYGGAGAMSDTEITGSSSVKGKGLVITINAKDQLSFSYRNASGVDVTENGIDGSGTPFTEQDPVYATGVSIDQGNVSVEQGRSVKLSATVTPADATRKSVTWTSDNESIATVSSSGKVKGVNVGTTTIRATTVPAATETGATFSAAVTVTVTQRTSADPYYVITVTDSGTTYAMSSEASTDKYSTSSSSSSSYGYTGLKAVAYTEGDELEDTSLLWTVVEDDDGYVITSFEGDILSATYTSSGSSSWSSNASANLKVGETEDVWVVDIDEWENGAKPYDKNSTKTLSLEKGSAGTYLFTVRSDSNADTSYLTMSDYSTEPVALQSIALDKTSASIAIGRSVTLKASFTPRNATNKAVTWTSSDPSVATVENGKVTGLKVGTTTITVASTDDPSIKATCAITVTEAPAIDYYVITATDSGTTYALTNVKSSASSSGSSSSSSSNYKYTGLKAVKYTGEDDIDETMLFYVEEVDGGLNVFDVDGNYLFGTYESGSSSGAGNLAVGTTADVWATTVSDWAAGKVVKSTNATGSLSSAKYLALENSGSDYFFSVRSESNADTTKLVEVNYSTTPVEITDVSLPATATVEVGKTTTVKATLTPSNASARNLTWTTSNSSVATVSGGTITGKSEGTATITATAPSGKSATCTVTVTPSTTPRYVRTDTLEDGGEYLIVSVASGSGYAATNPGVSGSSSSSYSSVSATAVTVSGSGSDAYIDIDGDDIVWTATASGSGFLLTNNSNYLEASSSSARVYKSQYSTSRTWSYNSSNQLQFKSSSSSSSSTYTMRYSSSSGFTSSSSSSSSYTLYLFKLVTEPQPVSGVSLDKSTLSLAIGRSSQLTAKVAPANAIDKTVNWTSSDTSVASVDSTGKVTALKVGSTTITAASASDATKYATCVVTVTEVPDVDYYVITATDSGTTYALTNVKSSASSAGSSSSSSSNYKYTGLVAVKYTGEDDITDSMLFTIEEVDGGLYVYDIEGNYLFGTYTSGSNSGSGDLAVGTTADVWATTVSDWAAGKVVKSTNATGSLSSAKYLALENSGSDYFFSVRSESNADTTTLVAVNVSTEPVAVTGVSVSPTSTSLSVGKTAQLTATVAPAKATNKAVSWTSSNEAVATVDASGKVTAKSAGSATITVTTADGGYTATCAVTVAESVSVTYTQATTLEAGKEYIIANGTNGSVYVVSNEAGSSKQLKGISADAASGVIVLTEDEAEKATFTVELASSSDSETIRLKNASGYLYADSSDGLRIANSSTVTSSDNSTKYWHYKADSKNLLWFFKGTSNSYGYTDTSSTYKYYLELSGSVYTDNHVSTTSLSNTSTPAIYIFEKSGSVTPVHTHSLTLTAAVAATCETAGNSAYYTCSGCGKYFSDAAGENEIAANSWVIPAKGHDWQFDGFVWTGNDTDGYTAVAAKYVCANDASHTQSVSAALDKVSSSESCTEPGTVTYTASITAAAALDGTARQATKQVEGVVAGHSWEFKGFTWDGNTAIANYECTKDQATTTKAATMTSSTTPATCDAAGSVTYNAVVSAADSFDGVEHTTSKTVEGAPATGHDWEFVSFTWSGSETAGYTAVANYKCKNDASHTQTVDAAIAVESSDASCTTPGTVTYTASVSAAASLDKQAHADTKTVSGAALGHNWEFKGFTWTGTDVDGYVVTAHYECTRDHVTETVNATISTSVTAATCDKPGKTTYTATVSAAASLDGQAHTDAKEVTSGSALGHDWVFEGYTWTGNDADGYSAIANYVCAHDSSHTDGVSASITASTKKATCEEPSNVTYTAIVSADRSLDGARHTGTKVITGSALGHAWEFAGFVWSGNDADGYTAEAQYVCANDASHIQTVAASISATSEDATCTTPGTVRYTATITAAASLDGARHSDTKVIEGAALGHDWEFRGITWTGNETDGFAAVANYRCKNDASHTQTVVAMVSTTTQEPTCDAAGTLTYTATVSAASTPDGIGRSDAKTFEGKPALGHTWVFVDFTWNGDAIDGYAVTANYKCANDASHTQTAMATVAQTTVDATCEEAGYVSFTANVSASASPDGQRHSETKTTTIAALGHNFGAWTVTKPATCEEAGIESSVCSRCGETLTREIAALGHDFGDWHVTTAPTCENAGVESRNCSRCSETETRAIAALGHEWDAVQYVWNVDESGAYVSVTATRACLRDASHNQTETVGLDANKTLVIAPTDTADGHATYVSKAFTNPVFEIQTKEIVLPATGHTLDFNNISWTWVGNDKDGYTGATAKVPCVNNDGYFITAEANVSAQTTPATNTENGKTVYTATVNINGKDYTATKTVVIPAEGHYNEWVRDETGQWTYYNDKGQLVKSGWVQYGEYWYYLDANGHPLTNTWFRYDNAWYHFAADGKCETDTWIRYNGNWYYLGSNGKAVWNTWVKDGDYWYYFDYNGKCLYDSWVSYGGNWYHVDSQGRCQTNEWISYNGSWYYVGADGKAVRNYWAPYNGLEYWIGADGKATGESRAIA